MFIIPVLDLKNQCAVAAKGGRRAHYKPLNPYPLNPYRSDPTNHPTNHPSGNALRILARLSDFYSTIYFADINALEGAKPQTNLLKNLRRRFPLLKMWLDGVSLTGFCPIVGSESLTGTKTYQRQMGMLSLDYRHQTPILGTGGIMPPKWRWSKDVIFINLAAVGGGNMDLTEVYKMARTLSHNRRLIVGGGVKNLNHLRLLKAKPNIKAVLVGSLWHKSWMIHHRLSKLLANPNTQQQIPSFQRSLCEAKAEAGIQSNKEPS